MRTNDAAIALKKYQIDTRRNTKCVKGSAFREITQDVCVATLVLQVIACKQQQMTVHNNLEAHLFIKATCEGTDEAERSGRQHFTKN